MRNARLTLLLLAGVLLGLTGVQADAASERRSVRATRRQARSTSVRATAAFGAARSAKIVSGRAFAPAGAAREVTALPEASKATLRSLGPLAAFVPAGTRARVMALSGFEHHDVELSLDGSQLRVGVDGPVQVELALNVLDYASQRIAPTAGRPVKTVLVPMAGYDAGSAARLFPDAETIIGVEARPFLDRTRAPRVVAYASLRSSNYTHWQAIEEMHHMAPAVLSSLAWAVPGFRLRGVTLVETPGLDHGQSAVIEFDGGVGTQPRRYVHLNEWFPNATPTPASAPWWWKALGAHPPDAVIVKGSQDWRSHASTAGVRHTMRAWLKGGGVLVEGDGEFTDRELSPLAMSHADASHARAQHAVRPVMTTKLDDVRFGYDGLRATGF